MKTNCRAAPIAWVLVHLFFNELPDILAKLLAWVRNCFNERQIDKNTVFFGQFYFLFLQPLRVGEFSIVVYEDWLSVDFLEHIGNFLEKHLALHFSWVHSAQKGSAQPDCNDNAVLFRLVLHCLILACNIIEVGEYDLCALAFSHLNPFYHSVDVDELMILDFPLQNLHNVLLIKWSIDEHKWTIEGFHNYLFIVIAWIIIQKFTNNNFFQLTQIFSIQLLITFYLSLISFKNDLVVIFLISIAYILYSSLLLFTLQLFINYLLKLGKYMYNFFRLCSFYFLRLPLYKSIIKFT